MNEGPLSDQRPLLLFRLAFFDFTGSVRRFGPLKPAIPTDWKKLGRAASDGELETGWLILDIAVYAVGYEEKHSFRLGIEVQTMTIEIRDANLG